MSTYIHLELINPSAREVFFLDYGRERRVGGGESEEEKRTWLKLETTSEIKETVDPQTLADGSISVRGKLMDTL